MKSMFLTISVLVIFCVSCTSERQQVNSFPAVGENGNEDVSTITPEREIKYHGCWMGMRGGKLKITDTFIFDISANQQASYKEVSVKQDDFHVEYVLEASEEFSKSFLAKFIRFSSHTDGKISFTGYRSYDDYLKDNFVGFGLFNKVSCDLVEK